MYCEYASCMISTDRRIAFDNGKTLWVCAYHERHAVSLLEAAGVTFSVQEVTIDKDAEERIHTELHGRR